MKLNLLKHFVPKEVRNLAADQAEMYKEVKARLSAEDSGTSTAQAAKSTEVIFTPPPVFKSAASLRQEFEFFDYHQKGLDDGEALHSNKSFLDFVNKISGGHKKILKYEIADKRDEIYKADIDLGEAGADSEAEIRYKKRIVKLNAELAELLIEEAKNHKEDETAGCHTAIMDYRRGYNAGEQRYFLTSGLKS